VNRRQESLSDRSDASVGSDRAGPPRRLLRLGALDVLLAAALVALPAWTLVRGARRAGERAEARISRAGKLLGVYPLDRDARVDVGDAMTVEIHAGRVRVAESNCPKGICKHSGWVGTPGRSIICVPNKVVIELVGAGGGYDTESY
jgi:hypothetical protein